MKAVGAAELVHEAAARPVVGARRAAGRGHGLGAGFGLDLVQALGHLGDGLVVGNLLPLALALLAHALERMVDAGGVVQMQKGAVAAAAEAALVRVIGIALDLDHLPVLHIGEDAAVRMAEVAQRLAHLYAGGVDVNLVPHGQLSSSLFPYRPPSAGPGTAPQQIRMPLSSFDLLNVSYIQ